MAVALPGHEWSAGLIGWLRSFSDPRLSHQRSVFELTDEPLSRWMFRALVDETGHAGRNLLSAYPAYVLLALLAPMAGINPLHAEDHLNSLVASATRRPDNTWLTRAVIKRLLCALFGDDVKIHSPGKTPLPPEGGNAAFWAALGSEGKLWVSDARWGQAGAFLIEYPSVLDHQTFPAPVPTHRIRWDAHFEHFLAETQIPQILTWASTEAEEVTAPWARQPSHPMKSMLDLVTSLPLEAANLAASPASNHWRDSVQVSQIDPARRRVISFCQEKSELLCHTEAWLAGLRFESVRRNEQGPDACIDAAELLSVVSSSIGQCAIEKRLMEMLDRADENKINWASLHNQPEGEWLQGMVEDLLGVHCRSANITFGEGRLPEALHQSRNGAYGLMQVWLSEARLPEGKAPAIPTRQLNINVQGRLLHNTPVTLSRDFVRGESGFPRGLRVVFGEAEPPVPKGQRRLVFVLGENEDPAMGNTLEHRANMQRDFWNAVLDFNEPRA